MLDKRVDDVLIQSRRNDFRASEHAPLFSVVHGNPLDLSQIPVMDLAIKLDDLLEESNLIKSHSSSCLLEKIGVALKLLTHLRSQLHRATKTINSHEAISRPKLVKRAHVGVKEAIAFLDTGGITAKGIMSLDESAPSFSLADGA